MSDVIETSMRGDIRVITINNPPVNALNVAVVSGLKEAVEAANKAKSVKGMVITGAGRTFIAGADIREFGKPRPKKAPTLRDAIAVMDASPKTIVAAINGAAAGGGLEVALACHYRVSTDRARLGLPEVKIGTIPGASGTQLLPRLIGVEAALKMIVGGDLIPGARAQSIGIVDEVADDVVTRAVEIAGEAPPRRASEMNDRIDAAKGHPEIFENFRKQIARRSRGFEAPFACIDAVEFAVNEPYDVGMKKELELFVKLTNSPQAAAQRHVFFADREVAKIPDVPPDTPVLPITSAGIIGCGTMGGGIAMNFANAGIPVKALELKQDALDRGMDIIRTNYANTVSKGRLSQEAMDSRMALISGTTDYDDLGDVDIMIEAAFEDMDVKKEIFAKLDEVAKADAILATNTSTLDVDEIASATKRPEMVIGTHFFSPANVMMLLENVRGAKSSKETIATVMSLSKTLGKIGVLVGVCDGFVGNRMLYAYTRQAGFLLEEGALPQQVDKVIYDFGLPMGPFTMGDMAGLDIGWMVRKSQAKARPTNRRYSPIADRICELGRYGQKTSAGWYRYEGGSRAPIPDPEIEQLIVEISEEAGFKRRSISDEEILERCMYPLVNEGAKILEEGIALRSLDIDIVWIYGYGFPRYRGGPMFWADSIGLKKVLSKMKRFYDKYDSDWLEPAPLLQQLAKEGKGFKDYSHG